MSRLANLCVCVCLALLAGAHARTPKQGRASAAVIARAVEAEIAVFTEASPEGGAFDEEVYIDVQVHLRHDAGTVLMSYTTDPPHGAGLMSESSVDLDRYPTYDDYPYTGDPVS